MISHPQPIVQIKVYETDLEYEMAGEIKYLRRTKKNCEKTMFFLGFVIIAILTITLIGV